jgi:hypothetical protein
MEAHSDTLNNPECKSVTDRSTSGDRKNSNSRRNDARLESCDEKYAATDLDNYGDDVSTIGTANARR